MWGYNYCYYYSHFSEEESMLWNVKCIDQGYSVQKRIKIYLLQQFGSKTYVFITTL